MSNKKLATLGIIAAVMVVWAVVQSKVSNTAAHKETSGTAYLVSGVNADDISSITIKSGKDTLTLRRKSKGFVVVNKDNYPADTQKINDLITDCLEIKVSQMVTDNPANHADLGVTEDKAQKVVRFFTPDANELFGVIVGNSKGSGQGTYVRLASSDKVYLASQPPYVDDTAINYVKQQLVAIVHKDIQLVTVESPNGKYILKPKTDSEDVELVNIPEGKKLKESDAKNVFNALSSLNFSDVKKDSDDLKFDRHYICKLFNSTEFTFDIASKDDKTFVKCRAVFTEGKPPATNPDEKLSQDQLKERENKLLLDKKADDFTSRNLGWVYEIPSYKAKYLTTDLSSLVENDTNATVTGTSDPNAILNQIQSDDPSAGS